MRVGDDERDETVRRLQDLYVRGVLDETELGERVDRALRARTSDDLAALDADCRPVPTRRHAAGSVGVLKVLAVTAVLAAAAAGGGVALGAGGAEDGDVGICVATGLSSTGECPSVSTTQEALFEDAERAAAAAEQARLAADGGGARLHRLATRAQRAAARAEAAAAEGRTLVATATKSGVDDAAMARAAATAARASDVAATAAIEADAAAERSAD